METSQQPPSHPATSVCAGITHSRQPSSMLNPLNPTSILECISIYTHACLPSMLHTDVAFVFELAAGYLLIR